MRTITEYLAKRIRRGHAVRSAVPDALILKWAEQYRLCRSYGVLPR